MGKTKFCQGISDISDSYSAFIIDQWGVLHNGEKPYEDVIDCLKELKRRNKELIILSNSGKRADYTKERMKKLGIGPTLYDTIVTSGEIAWQGLKDQSEGFFEGLGERCYVINKDNDLSLLEGLDIEVVDSVSKASFVLITGTDAPHKTLVDDYEPILKEAVRHRLKAVCANPDSRALRGSTSIMGPGLVARRYQDFGGVVHYVGKPHKPIFQHCIKMLQQKEIYPGETVMIGDTMAHDIIGAASLNLDTCLVRNGLHYGAFKNCKNAAEVDHTLNILSLQHNNVRPTYLVDRFKWGKALPDRKHKKRKIA
jgi:HAD superfamily hydrolase (TIGR01459 family)